MQSDLTTDSIDVQTERLAQQAVPSPLLPFQRPVNTIVQENPATSGSVSAHYVTTQSEASLPNEFSLGGLSAGLLAHTISGGVSTPIGRTLTAASASIVITNGTGGAGNPTVDTAQDIRTSAAPTFLGATLTGILISALPGGTAGMIRYVTDGDAALAWGATVVNTGAGATKYLVWFNGTNWTVVGS